LGSALKAVRVRTFLRVRRSVRLTFGAGLAGAELDPSATEPFDTRISLCESAEIGTGSSAEL